MKKINWLNIVLFVCFSTVCIIGCKQKTEGKEAAKASLLRLAIGDIVKEGADLKPKMIFPAVEFSTEKVPIECVVKPIGSSITFVPALDKDGNWVLSEGNNTLKVTIGTGKLAVVYEAEVMRHKLNAKLTSLKIGDKTAEISHEMDFGRIYSKKVLVEFSADPPDSKVTFEPALDSDNFISLKDGENIVNITVANGKSKNTYKAKIMQGKIRGEKLADYILIRGGAIKGKRSAITPAQAAQLVNGENITVELSGPEASIVLASRNEKWMSVKINGKSYIPMSNFGNYASADTETIALPEQGKTLDVKIELETFDKISEMNFKIKRLNGAVDIPAISLMMMDKDVDLDYTESGKTVLDRLFEGGANKPDIKAAVDPATVGIRCTKDVMGKVLINGENIQIREQKRKDTGKTIRWLCKHDVSGASTSPNYKKEVKIEIIPKDTSAYNTTKWTFDIITIPDDKNAQFKFLNSAFGARHDISISAFKWYDNGGASAHPNKNDYGALSAVVTAGTVIPDASVYYSLVSGDKKESAYTWILENEKTIKSAVKMENNGGKHSARIEFYNDKPTFIKLYVVAKDGSTQDNVRGLYYYECNSIDLKWDYAKKDKGENFTKTAYDVIEVKKSEIPSDGKIYAAFLISADTKYKISGDKITKLDNQGLKQWYCLEVDVSALKNSTQTELTVSLPIFEKKDGKPDEKCFEYKIKVKAMS